MTEGTPSGGIFGEFECKNSKKNKDKGDTSATVAVSKIFKTASCSVKTTDEKRKSSKQRCILNTLDNLVQISADDIGNLQISGKKRERVEKKHCETEKASTKERLNKCTDGTKINDDIPFQESKGDTMVIQGDVKKGQGEKIYRQRKPKKSGKRKNDTANIKGKNETPIPVSTNSKSEKNQFPDYMHKMEIEKILNNQSSDNIQYVHGYLRINSKFHQRAYVSLSDDESDLLIVGIRDRNRAFDGDLVVASINEEEKWLSLPDGKKQKTGVIVYILDKIHPRTAVGHLKKAKSDVLLYPRDPRIPLIVIQSHQIPRRFAQEPDLYKSTLFLAKIVTWNKPRLAIGRIVQEVGPEGDLVAESNAILLEHDLDVTPYSVQLLKELPSADYIPTDIDIKGREDWRNKCIFTIDPATAVDLDDAVSCEMLDNGNYEIGVHIADVTYYLKFLSPLDVEVAKRATTVYMTDKAYHMLPKQLCQTCSLLPGHDKLAFSIVWEMTPDAKVVSHRFTKTAINSCCQLSYDDAQKIIKYAEKDFPGSFPTIERNFTVSQLYMAVKNLYNLSVHMQNERCAGGALNIDVPKIHVTLDSVTGIPVSCDIEKEEDSNRLIKEFMLLANMTVATHLYNEIPETALLREHRKPKTRVLMKNKEMLQKFGIHLDVESAESLQASITRYASEFTTDCLLTKITVKYRMMALNSLCAAAMTRALYKCASSVESKDDLRHYALNVPLYTHFTSPIRRYSDCVVHRLLYSTIEHKELPLGWSKKLCTQIAENCNIKKYSAAMAQEKSGVLYFTYLVHLIGPLNTIAIVLYVRERSIDVILCHCGIKLKICLADTENISSIEYSLKSTVPTISITWKKSNITQVITTFSLLQIRVQKDPKFFRLNGVLLPPVE